jgi:hypothetical protein
MRLGSITEGASLDQTEPTKRCWKPESLLMLRISDCYGTAEVLMCSLRAWHCSSVGVDE